MSIGDAHGTVWCASPFCIRGEMEMYTTVYEIEMVKETEMVRDDRDGDI
jgi:hypothetical protein